MNVSYFSLSLLAVVAAGALVYFQYYYKKKVTHDTRLISIVRFISLLSLLILLFNPKFEHRQTEIKKPTLILAVDNSASIKHRGCDDDLKSLRQLFLGDKDLNKRFDMSYLNFEGSVSTDTVLSFEAQKTDIHKVIQDANALAEEEESPIVLLTDGQQTYGKNFTYMISGNPVFPMVIGDTIAKADIWINRINVNAFATLGNTFPVEIFLGSNAKQKLNSTLIVERKGVELYKVPVNFSPEKKAVRLLFHLQADSSGMQLYKAKLLPFTGENETRNNNKSFGVEILDEQSEVAIIYNVLHPDLGMIKRSVESNQQRRAVLLHTSEFESSGKEYPICILYQPDASFKKIIPSLLDQKRNMFIVTGGRTDWKFLNKSSLGFSKETSGLIEDCFPAYQNSFNTFYTEDIGFESFPPLKGQLGETRFSEEHDYLLTQTINDIKTGIPMLATYAANGTKGVVLLGENIWKWRAHCYDAYGSFDKFDLFFNSLIQFVQLSGRENGMDLFYEPVFHAGENISIRVKKYDSNLNLELNSRLSLHLSDSISDTPFYLKDNAYEVQLKGLTEGEYSFVVDDLDSDDQQRGSFVVVPYSIEEEAVPPNTDGLRLLAENSGGRLYFSDQFSMLKNDLMKNPQFRAVEKQRTNLISLIDWKWLLGLIVLSLSLEWLLRKYRGLV